MTAVEEEAPAAAEDALDPDLPDALTGLSLNDEAAILLHMAQITSICQEGIRFVLSAQRPALAEHLEAAESELEEARAMLAPSHAKVEFLTGQLEECRTRLGTAELAVENAGEDTPLDAQVDARRDRVALREMAEVLEQRIQLIHRASDPYEMRKIEADRKVKAARLDLEDLDRALESPLGHSRGRATEAYRKCMLRTGLWLDEGGADARQVLMMGLRSTGLGAEIETNAIRAFTAGDPAAVAVGGSTKRWRDGTTLHYTPGAPPVVSHGQATYADLATVPAVPTMAPSGAEVMTGVRTAAGWPA